MAPNIPNMSGDRPPSGRCTDAYRDEDGNDLFFGDIKGQNLTRAKRLCSICPVRLECLQFAIDHTIRYGIWGGKSPKERRHIARLQRKKRRAV